MVHSMDSQICLKVESLYVGKYTAERWNFHQIICYWAEAWAENGRILNNGNEEDISKILSR